MNGRSRGSRATRQHVTGRVLLGMAMAAAWLVSVPVLAEVGKAVPASVGLGRGSALWLEGGSNVHDWEARTSDVQVAVLRDPAAAEPASAPAIEALVRESGVRAFTVTVPVRSLHSHKDALDKNLYKAMKAEQHPNVRFALTGYTVSSAAGDTFAVSVPGKLTITDVTRDVTLQGRLWKDGDGLWIQGMHVLKMTEYGIKPPTMMMGAMRTHDRVEVHYRLLLVPTKGTSGVPSASNSERSM